MALAKFRNTSAHDERESRFPKALLTLEAARIADGLRRAADQLDDLAETAFAYELGTLRRNVREVVVTVSTSVAGLVETA